MKGKKITIYDIAEIAGVSVGTVNRAINNKPRISPKTKKLVLDTAKKLGYKANVAAQGLRRSQITIGAILFCPIDEYVNSIVEGIYSAAGDLEKYNVTLEVNKIDYTNSIDCLNKTRQLIRGFAENNYNGIILFMSAMADEMSELSDLINELTEKNIFFATVANDIFNSKRVIHVGVDAFMAGQMAAQLLELSCRCKDVALLVTSNDSPVNAQYINGFMKYSKDNLFSSVKIYEHYDDEVKIIATTNQMIKENPNLKGIYMTTAASSIACNHIKTLQKTDLCIITTDLLKETPGFLKNKIASATIFQNPYRQGRNVLKYLYQYITSQKCAGVHLIPPHILLSSNLNPYLNDEML